MRPHLARKRFGQHFLVDQQIIADIVDLLAVRRDDLLVEIGPGLGALTNPLLTRLDHLQVVEIDRDIIARLRQGFSPEKLTVHSGDALVFDFGQLARDAGAGLRVVGNLPYNISTPLLFHLAGFAHRVRDMHFMLQKEVVERMVAVPGSSEFGRLSVMLQYRFVMDRLLDVPPEAFNPVPQGALGSGPLDSPASSGVICARRKAVRCTGLGSLRAAAQDAAQQPAGLPRRRSSGGARCFADLSRRGPVGR
jgi:16S rRNA (adenine1518-N6/adenine1519-N6)-dimethyltransferase